MPNRATRRAMQQSDEPEITLRLTVQGVPYEVRASDLSGKDEMDFYLLTSRDGQGGMILSDVFQGKVNLIGLAGVVWAIRRRYEKKLSLQDVLKDVNMAVFNTLELDDGKGDDPDPEDAPYRLPEHVDPEDSGAESGTSYPSSAPSTD